MSDFSLLLMYRNVSNCWTLDFQAISRNIKISNDQKRLLVAVNLYTFSFFANTPFLRNINIYFLDFSIFLKWTINFMSKNHKFRDKMKDISITFIF